MFPDDFIAPGIPTEEVAIDGDVVVGTHLMTHGPLVARGSVRIGQTVIDLLDDARAQLVGRAARTHEGRSVQVRLDPGYCQLLLTEHDAYIESHRADLLVRAATITADQNLQRAIVTSLIDRIFHVRR